jgi:hypothetical protein
MTNLIAKIIGGALGALVLVGVLMWVFRLGPFNPGPSPAAKVQAQTTKAVTKTQAEETAAVQKAGEKAGAAIADTTKRTQRHAAQIRAAERTTPAGAPDAADAVWFGSVCQSVVYKGNPDCRGYSGRPEGSGPAAGQGAVRGR